MKAYYYIDTRDREIFHLPGVFVTIVSKEGKEDVILDVKRLRRRDVNMERHKKTIERGLVAIVDIPDNNIKPVIKLCFENKLDEARSYVKGIFDYIASVWDEEELEVPGWQEGTNIDDYDPRQDSDGYDFPDSFL